MHAVIRRYRVAEGVTAADLLARVQQGFVPVIREMPGFVAFHAIATDDDGVVSVSIFADREGADRSTERAAGHIQRELAAYFAGPPEITRGEVGAHAVAASTTPPATR